MSALEPSSTSSVSPTLEPAVQETEKVAAKKTVIAVGLGLIIAISWMGFIDSQSAAYIDSALKQALVTYGVARGVNAVVSVLQTIHLFGLGVGEVLDPINDLVERFSSVMELAIGSLFIQKVLLEITSSLFFKFALTASGGLLILALYVRTGINTLLISRVFVSLVFIRFSIAIVVLLNGMVSAAFVTDKIDADVAVVEQVEKSAPAPEQTAEDVAVQPAPQTEPTPEVSAATGTETIQTSEPEKKSLFGKLADFGTKLKDVGAKAVVVVKEKVKKWDPKAMKEKIEKVVPQMLNLMALFLLKTLILPLVFLYGLKYALEQVWNIKPIPLYTGKPRLTL
jgi:hypothetical protein